MGSDWRDVRKRAKWVRLVFGENRDFRVALRWRPVRARGGIGEMGWFGKTPGRRRAFSLESLHARSGSTAEYRPGIRNHG
jgi:hypothetical protein